jgi:hypothetical protein
MAAFSQRYLALGSARKGILCRAPHRCSPAFEYGEVPGLVAAGRVRFMTLGDATLGLGRPPWAFAGVCLPFIAAPRVALSFFSARAVGTKVPYPGYLPPTTVFRDRVDAMLRARLITSTSACFEGSMTEHDEQQPQFEVPEK